MGNTQQKPITLTAAEKAANLSATAKDKIAEEIFKFLEREDIPNGVKSLVDVGETITFLNSQLEEGCLSTMDVHNQLYAVNRAVKLFSTLSYLAVIDFKY